MTETNRIEYKRELSKELDLELVEQLGSGVPRILEVYDRACFKFYPNFIRMTFLKNDYAISGAIGGAMNEKLTERQIEILQMIEENNKISYRTVAEKLKINYSAAQEHFEILKSKWIIERVGGTRGYWKLNVHVKNKHE